MTQTSELRSQFRSLSRRRKLQVVLIAVYLFWHALATLVGGLRPGLRDPIWPAFDWYGDGLRMINSWGMFSRPHADEAIFSYGLTEDGRRHPLYPPEHATLERRLMDQRLRKLQSHLGKDGNRKRWGKTYVQQLCRSVRIDGEALSAVELELILPGQEDRLRKTKKVIHHGKCRRN